MRLEMGRREKRSCDAQHPLAGALWRGWRKSLVEREGWARQLGKETPGGKEPTAFLGESHAPWSILQSVNIK